ncbi:MAG TPA: septal ring lytic transglycosylase RlpA family protein [Candidatus Binataceae bacterium]|nr:septal ring lytic transglycosylase RlpA family protein [Candidatus Binataceae bacterium]
MATIYMRVQRLLLHLLRLFDLLVERSLNWSSSLAFGLGVFAMLLSSPLVSAQTAVQSDSRQPADSKAAVTPSDASSAHSQSRSPAKTIHAKASWYGPGLQGHETSTGEKFNSHKLTAASSKLPLGSTAEVKNLQNGRHVKVKINDCGPDAAGRKVDLSSSAANKLKMKHAGVVPVEVKVLHQPAGAQPCTQ